MPKTDLEIGINEIFDYIENNVNKVNSLVSVIVTAFDRKQLLSNTIKFILNQTPKILN